MVEMGLMALSSGKFASDYQKNNTLDAIHHITVATKIVTDFAWQMHAFYREHLATLLVYETRIGI